jgi:hypothetical protein
VKWASIRVGGTYVTTGGVGTLQALSGEGLAVNGNGLTHTSPKAGANGVVTFRFGWKAPSTPGAVPFYVNALAGNGNNASSGDAGVYGLFQWVYGCTARTLYADSDRDGYGGHLYDPLLACAGGPAREGYVPVDGDCDENNESVNPGAAEVCNGKDDNCDGQIDENAPAGMLWPDGDGDGYYKQMTGTPRFGCGIPGFALLGGDCVDNDPAIHPGATEICNGRDDNCNGQTDERVRPQCGVGWCRRESPTCRVEDCVPGPPMPEQCNLADDDCNGEVDDQACPAGLTCQVNQCVAGGSGGTLGGADAGASGGSGGSATGSGGSGRDAGDGSGGSSGSGGMSGASGMTGATAGSGGASVTGSSPGGGCSLIVATTTGTRGGDDDGWLTHAGIALALLSLLSTRRRRS